MNSGMLISKNALKAPRIYVAITWPLPERCRKKQRKCGCTESAGWVNKFIKGPCDIWCWDPHGQMQEIFVTWIHRKNTINLMVFGALSFSLVLLLLVCMISGLAQIQERVRLKIIVGGGKEYLTQSSIPWSNSESGKIRSICFSNEVWNWALPVRCLFVLSYTSDLFGHPQRGVVC